eukprot:364927-Chlamydomonas_euryale.AAC.20
MLIDAQPMFSAHDPHAALQKFVRERTLVLRMPFFLSPAPACNSNLLGQEFFQDPAVLSPTRR